MKSSIGMAGVVVLLNNEHMVSNKGGKVTLTLPPVSGDCSMTAPEVELAL